MDKQESVQRRVAAGHLGSVRADLVVIRGLTLGWNMAFISHGTFMTLTTKRDDIESNSPAGRGGFCRQGC
ncbi:hypothetical protein [Yersinia rohdei]|uniref:hypothetical protein n=1 Tax=Yersinia rohdei TaxID=29485 RepID=UPI0011A7ADF4|nr:hypothetical protein [Yersinia rohdei]